MVESGLNGCFGAMLLGAKVFLFLLGLTILIGLFR